MACQSASPSADCYLQFAHELQGKCLKLGRIKGASKLERKVTAEVRFLKNLLRKNKEVQESHLKSSNLSHYAAIVHAAENLPGTVEILQPFQCPGKNESLIVDVVAGQGHIWVKVIARKAQALHLVWAGHGQFGERDLLRQSQDYLDSAEQHPHIFTSPDVYFIFYNNVTFSMAAALQDRGVKVLGYEVPVDENVEHKLMNLHLEEEEEEGETDSDQKVKDREDSEGEDSLETDCVIMSAGEFLKSSTRIKGQRETIRQVQAYEDKHFSEEKREMDKSRDIKKDSAESNITVSGAFEMVDQEISLSCKTSPLRKTTLPSSVDTKQCDVFVPCETYTPDYCLSVNIDSDADNSNSPSSVSCLSSVCEHEVILETEVVDTQNSSQTISVSKGLTKATSETEEHECSWNLLQTKAHEGVGATCESHHWQRGESDICDHSYAKQYTSVPSCSENYNLLMTELLGVIPDIANSIVDHSWDIINSISKVNLDITTLITLVSAVTHGHCNYVFTEKILTMQAQEEREMPVLPSLEQFMKGKDLYACRTAVKDFNTILATLGGDGEKQRAHELLGKVTIIEDNPSHRTVQLKNLGKIKDRSKIIFGTGDSLKAITMTANSGFLRAAEGQGVSFAVFVHAARALTEDKEKTATLIENT